MGFSIDIDYPLERMEGSRKRMEARPTYGYADRVPVGFCLAPRYFTPIFDIPYNEIFRDARTQYHWQLEFAKYRIENIPEDIFCTAPTITVMPYFDNVIEASAYGAEIIWPENETLFSRPTIHTVEEMDALEIPSPTSGLWGKMCEWWEEMNAFARDTRVTFNGQEGQVVVAPPTISGMGPHMTAIDLIGENFYWWAMEYPEQCHAFMMKITQGYIQAQKYFMELSPRPWGGCGLAEDCAQIMSIEQFRELVVPYDNMYYDACAGGPDSARGMHMCGISTHLHEALTEDLHITSFDVFGYQVPPQKAAENLGGRTMLWGNVNPMLMLDGSKSEVKAASREALETMAPCGGFMLGDGANVCPGTPLENLVAFTEAAEEYGKPEVVSRPAGA